MHATLGSITGGPHYYLLNYYLFFDTIWRKPGINYQHVKTKSYWKSSQLCIFLIWGDLERTLLVLECLRQFFFVNVDFRRKDSHNWRPSAIRMTGKEKELNIAFSLRKWTIPTSAAQLLAGGEHSCAAAGPTCSSSSMLQQKQQAAAQVCSRSPTYPVLLATRGNQRQHN